MDLLSDFVNHPVVLLICIAIAVPILWRYWRWFFGDFAGFTSEAAEAAAPDWLSLIRGKYWQGEWAEVKIIYFALLCIGVTAALYKLAVVMFY